MKKISQGFLISLFIFVSFVSVGLADAQQVDVSTNSLKSRLEATPATSTKVEKMDKLKGKAVNQAEKRKEAKETAKENVVERVRKSVISRFDVFTRTVRKAEILLEKIEVRITKAREAGKNTNEAEKLLGEAKTKLADAKTKLTAIKDKKDIAINRAGFLEIHNQFKAIGDDLHQVRIKASRIISILKGFNSATSEGKNPQKEGTTPGTKAN